MSYQAPTPNPPLYLAKRGLMTTSRPMSELHRSRVPAFSPKTAASLSFLNKDNLLSLKYVYTHTWLQRIGDHNIIAKTKPKVIKAI